MKIMEIKIDLGGQAAKGICKSVKRKRRRRVARVDGEE
jgi:hypothetical protein